MRNTKLKFAKGNAKLGKHIAILSLPAGFTCPGALECLSKSNRITGKIQDGKHTLFRCYAASSEALFPNIRKGRWNNFELLKGKSVSEMVELITRSLPRNVSLCRIHSSGDFFSQTYFDAWIKVAEAMPHVTFYAYTKALNFWLPRIGSIPNNLRLVASKGGRFDALISKHGLRCVEVVYSEDEAKELALSIDHDDSLAYKGTTNFALLLHGTQPAGSIAGKALSALRSEHKGGYKSDYFAHYDKAKK